MTKTRSIGPLRQCLVIAVALMSGGFMAGCSSTSTADTLALDDAARGHQPDFSRPLTAAMPQMSDEEAAATERQLTALAGERQNGTISEAEYWRRVKALQALAANHAGDAEKQIGATD